MVYRKGELSKSMVDRRWPHQVALPACRCLGHKYLAIHLTKGGRSGRARPLRSAETTLILASPAPGTPTRRAVTRALRGESRPSGLERADITMISPCDWRNRDARERGFGRTLGHLIDARMAVVAIRCGCTHQPIP